MKFSKLLAAMAASVGLLFGSLTLGAQDPWVNGGVQQGQVELLFAFQSKSARLTHLKGRQYELVIPLKDISSILAFSDRPNRIAYHLSPAKFAKFVHEGADTFDTDPPNLSLAWSDQRSRLFAYEVSGYAKTATHITYKLTYLSPKGSVDSPMAKTGGVSVFIDSSLATWCQVYNDGGGFLAFLTWLSGVGAIVCGVAFLADQ